MAAVPVSEDSFTDSTLMDKWYSDHDMHMMYVGEIVKVVLYRSYHLKTLCRSGQTPPRAAFLSALCADLISIATEPPHTSEIYLNFFFKMAIRWSCLLLCSSAVQAVNTANSDMPEPHAHAWPVQSEPQVICVSFSSIILTNVSSLTRNLNICQVDHLVTSTIRFNCFSYCSNVISSLAAIKVHTGNRLIFSGLPTVSDCNL